MDLNAHFTSPVEVVALYVKALDWHSEGMQVPRCARNMHSEDTVDNTKRQVAERRFTQSS